MIICVTTFASFCIKATKSHPEKGSIVEGLIDVMKHISNSPADLPYTLSELEELNNFIKSSLTNAGVYELYPELNVALNMDVVEEGYVMFIKRGKLIRDELAGDIRRRIDVKRPESGNEYEKEAAELSECKFLLNKEVTFAIHPSNKVTAFRVNPGNRQVTIETWQCGHDVFAKLEDISLLNDLNALLCEAV